LPAINSFDVICGLDGVVFAPEAPESVSFGICNFLLFFLLGFYAEIKSSNFSFKFNI
jgi:hypothetical protein